jgi:hypothetical protein
LSGSSATSGSTADGGSIHPWARTGKRVLVIGAGPSGLSAVAQAATLATRSPFVHFFDGFRTSHEVNTVELLSDDELRALVPQELIRAHRARALSPDPRSSPATTPP